MSEEILDNVSSQEMVEQYKELRTDGSGSVCRGNFNTECMRDGLNSFSEIADEEDFEYSTLGGIGTQLVALAYSEKPLELAEYVGRRATDDVDILVEDKQEAKSELRNSEYYETAGRPKIDVISPNDIFKDQGNVYEEILEESQEVDFSDIEDRYDFTLSVPTPEHLVYSKIQDPSNRNRNGTWFDLRLQSNHSELFPELDVDYVVDLVEEYAPQPEQSLSMLEESGFNY